MAGIRSAFSDPGNRKKPVCILRADGYKLRQEYPERDGKWYTVKRKEYFVGNHETVFRIRQKQEGVSL